MQRQSPFSRFLTAVILTVFVTTSLPAEVLMRLPPVPVLPISTLKMDLPYRQMVDHANGNLVSKKTDIYTGVKYAHGQMREFNLKTTVTGARKNWNATLKTYEIQNITKTTTLKQYGAKFDSSGNMTFYTQDSWSSSAPAKRTTQSFTQSNFDSEHQYHNQTIEMREKGSANGTKLDSLSYTVKSDIIWSNGKITGYTETSYTQKKEEEIGPNADPEKKKDKGYLQRPVSYTHLTLPTTPYV